MRWCWLSAMLGCRMNSRRLKLPSRYTATLQKYLRREGEAVLAEGYEVGRAAIGEGLGVLDMAQIHEEALQQLIQGPRPSAEHDRTWKAAKCFFLESLCPFEALHRGFCETNVRLQQLNSALEKRNHELARSNSRLEREIGERQLTEKALRQSELHFRQLFNQAQEMQEDLRELSERLLRVQEDERKRLSRELHDEVGQALTAVSVSLGTLRNNGNGHAKRAKALAGTQHLLRQAMDIVHHFARELRPAMLEELGLLPALRSYLKGFAERTGLQVRLRADPMAEKLGDEQKVVLFRIAQESLTNVAKHAAASRVEVVVHKTSGGVCMEVADNGKSFREEAVNSAQRRQRLGLLGMQERVRLVNGRFGVKPQPGKGTTVEVVVPFKVSKPMALSKWVPKTRTLT